MNKTKGIMLAGALVGSLALAANSFGTTISSNNSGVDFDAASNVVNWNVDGVDHLYYMANFWRIGNAGPETIFSGGVETPSASGRSLEVYYDFGTWDAGFAYAVVGGSAGSGQSTIISGFTIQNNTGQTQEFNIFQYVDLDLTNTFFDDTANQANQNSIHQWDGQTLVESAFIAPEFWQIADYPTLVNAMFDGVPTTLTNMNGSTGTDAEWAIQYQVSVADGGAFTRGMSFAMQPVPEPATMLLLGTGLAGLAGVARRRKQKK